MENMNSKGVTPEMIQKAKTAKSADELLKLAEENEIEMSAEETKAFFEQLNAKSGELSDDELDNVAGGGCKSSTGRTVVTSGCKCFTGKYMTICKGGGMWVNNDDVVRNDNLKLRMLWYTNCGTETCGGCRFLEFEGGIGVCGKS